MRLVLHSLSRFVVVLQELGNPMLKRFAATKLTREVSFVVHHGFVRTPLLTMLQEIILSKVPERLRASQAGQKI